MFRKISKKVLTALLAIIMTLSVFPVDSVQAKSRYTENVSYEATTNSGIKTTVTLSSYALRSGTVMTAKDVNRKDVIGPVERYVGEEVGDIVAVDIRYTYNRRSATPSLSDSAKMTIENVEEGAAYLLTLFNYWGRQYAEEIPFSQEGNTISFSDDYAYGTYIVVYAEEEEPVTPVEPEPTEPVTPVEPEPTEPVTPVEPEPTEPVTPVEPEPTEPVTFTSDSTRSTSEVVVVDETGAFEAGTEMMVEDIDQSEVIEKVNEVVDNGTIVNGVNISFELNGAEVQPDGEVKVSIDAALDASRQYKLVHIHDGKATVIDDAVFTESGVTFTTDEFSTFVIVTIVIPAEAGTYTAEENGVRVTVDVAEGTFDEAVVLTISKIENDSNAYAVAENELDSYGHEYDGMVAFDIHFESKATGKELEPHNPVVIKLEIIDAEKAGIPSEEVDYVTIAHVFDNGGIEIISEPEVENDDNTAPVDNGAEIDVFSTFTISWRSGGRKVTVHYVDENGTELTISNPDNTHPNLTANSSSPAFLIYDIEGYEYSYTYRNTNTNANRIDPLLAKDTNNRWMYNVTRNTTWGGTVYYTGTELTNRDNIYVVYKKETSPTAGGVPTVDPTTEQWPEEKPTFSKFSKDNGDDTNTISLTIHAAEKPVEKKTKANVIVVLDRSGSMNNTLSGNTSRLAAAKTAINTMARTFEGLGTDLVNMALIEFSTTAARRGDWTTSATTFANNTYVGGVTASGGTNWEQALKLANTIANKESDAATFIIFVTDGDPTFRVSRGDIENNGVDNYIGDDTYEYYRENGIYGQGNNDSYGYNFDFAVEAVEDIVAQNKTFYAIGVSSDVQKVQNLCSEAGVAADHAILATSTTELQNAFSTLASSIQSSLGYANVEITDGITDLTNLSMKVMQTVDTTSFKYYRYGGENNKYGADYNTKTEWTTRESDNCDEAKYNTASGAVEWNMGSDFQLEDGVTYVVEFRVWASQDAYNLVADLNNGIKVYEEGHENSITAEERAQIVEITAPTATSQGEYSLKTNTDNVSATYNKTSKTGDTVVVTDETPITATYIAGDQPNLSLESMKLTVKKVFEDDLTAGEDRATQVTLVIKRRDGNTEDEFVEYAVPQAGGTSANIVLNEENNWEYSLYVAPGLKVGDEILEHGYDFTITEPAIDYHYELIEEIVNPMLVDGEPTYLGDGDNNKALTALNRVKSGIDIKKVVIDERGNVVTSDVSDFTIRIKMLDAEGNGYTFNTAWDDREDVSQGQIASEEWKAHQNDSGAYHKYDKNGKRIGYKLHVADTADFTLTLKAGEYVRFINVPEGTTFEISEENILSGYVQTNLTAVTQHRVEAGGEFTQDGDVQPEIIKPNENDYVGSSAQLKGEGVVGNKQYAIEFTNQTQAFYVYHSGVAGDGNLEVISLKSVDENGNFDLLTTELTPDTLYGGYYLDYNGKGTYGGHGVKGEDGVKYTGLNSDGVVWTNAQTGLADDDPNKVDTKALIKPEADTTYYIKEVPTYYLRNYYQINYGGVTKELRNLYLISAIDDLKYDETGFVITSENKVAKIYNDITLKNSATNKSITLKANTVFKSLGITEAGEFLTFWDATDSDYFKAGSEFTVKPYWITPDGVFVTGISTRTITITEMTRSGISKTDD